MSDALEDDIGAAAQALVAKGDVAGAIAALSAALEREERADLRDLAAGLAYFIADYPAARAHSEAAFRAHRDAGSWSRAARVAMDLAEMHHSVFGNASASRGWLERAKRLLEGHADCVEWGYLELAIMACDRLDLEELQVSADRALALARVHGDYDLEIRALADGGMALVCQGQLRDGFARLDEALAALSAGEAREPATGPKSMCAVLTSCDRTGDVRRAEECTRIVEASQQTSGLVPSVLAEHCRLVQTGLLSAAGRWDEAESALQRLLDEMAPRAPHRPQTLANLARLRLVRGRLEEASALITPHADAVAMREPLARLHLVRNEPAPAIAVAEAAVRDLVTDRFRAAPLLDVVVQAHLQLGDITAAAEAARRLGELAESTESAAMHADAALARGRVAAARRDHENAVGELATARREFGDASRPLQAGEASLALAQVLHAAGDLAGAAVEARAALATFERLGADSFVDQTAQLLRALGSPVRTRSDASVQLSGLTPREAEVLDLIRAGLTNTEIGRRLFISAKTAEHHVSRVLTKLGVRTRAEAAGVVASARRGSTDPGVTE